MNITTKSDLIEDDDIGDILTDIAGKDLSTTLGLDEMLLMDDLKRRKLYMCDDIDPLSVQEIVHHILQYNADDKDIPVEDRAPIYLYIMSNGGDLMSGMGLVDVILQSKTPVYTINIGYWYSMALLIGLAGHKRFATQNSSVLLHDGSNFAYGSATKLQDRMQFLSRFEDRCRQYTLDRTNITPEEFDEKARVEWYMFADEAKEKGIIDSIVGIDCTMDEIV